MTFWSAWRARQAQENRLHVEVRGVGDRTLVFIPGLGGTTRYWASRIEPLEAKYRIILVDLLGFGESAKPWTQYSVERHLTALWSALARYAPFTLIGHSLGALLSVALAARHPHAVPRLVLLGMPCFRGQADAYHYYRRGPMRGGYLATNLLLTISTCLFTRWILGRVLPYLVRHVPREVAEDLVKHHWRSSTSSLWEVVYRYDASMDLARLNGTARILFIHGERDVMAPVAPIQRLAQHNERSLKVLPDADHHPFLREPAYCLDLIEAHNNTDRAGGPRQPDHDAAPLPTTTKENGS